MSPLRYQLFPGVFWEQIYQQRWEAAILNDSQMRPIVPQDIPIVPDGHILACYADSDSAKATWTSAGSIQQVYPSPTFSQGKLLAERSRVWLRQTTLIELPDRGPSYQLRYFPPRWLEDVELIIWQYTGPVGDPTAEALAALRAQVAALGQLGGGGNGGGTQGNGPDGLGTGASGSASFDNLDGGIG